MKIIEQQWEFMKDVARLIRYIDSTNLDASFGEAYRSKEQQEIYLAAGKTKTSKSLHMMRAAIDINFFREGKVVTDFESLKVFGIFWTSLDILNVWGGNWKFYDPTHFERRLEIQNDEKDTYV